MLNASGLREKIDLLGKTEACREILGANASEEEIDAWLYMQVMNLLYAGKRGGAGLLLWGPRLFNPEPICVQRVFRALNTYDKNLLQGGAGQGKSYSAIGWHLLDYWLDPQFTNVKLISTTAGHAKGGTYGTMIGLFRDALVTMPGETLSDYIGLDTGDRSNGVSIVAIKEGEDGGKILQGIHPRPRDKPHPTLGDSTRVRIMIDECELVPSSTWRFGIKNFLSSMAPGGAVKVTGAYNPADVSSAVASLSEPIGGLEVIDTETGVDGRDEWLSREGWHVTRLDPAKSENVQSRKVLFPGFQTYDGYRELMDPHDGNTPEAYIFGRGIYPPSSSIQIIIPSGFIETNRGMFEFIGSTVAAGGADIAVEGRDEAIYTLGRCGLASAFNRLVLNPRTRQREIDRITFKETRRVVQVDQMFPLPKGSTKIVADGIRKVSLSLGVSPEYCCVDRTGNGASIHDYLQEIWGPCQGVDFNKPATNLKITDQDRHTAEELYDGIVSEVWFALAHWLEFGYICFAPSINDDPLFGQLRGRRYIFGAGKKRRVEKKDDFKLRLGRSPDHADSLTLMLQGVRVRLGAMASMTGEKPSEPSGEVQHGPTDRVTWIT